MYLPRPLLAITALLVVSLFTGPRRAHAQSRPAEISMEESQELPYRESGKFTVTFGSKMFFGTATYIRRYTCLTAGHLLYDPDAGFAAAGHFQAAEYQDDPPVQYIGYFAVLSGYQAAAEADPDSDTSFSRDMGYFLLLKPSPRNEWAAFSADPALLTNGKDYLSLGYAAESFVGDELAFVDITAPYVVDLPGLYQNTSFYTEEGMSGGPVYIVAKGSMTIGAVNVAGTDPPHAAFSGARGITADVGPLLIDAEYTHGLITGAVLTGPPLVTAGSTATYKAGLTFADHQTEGQTLPHRYQEIELIPGGKGKHLVTVTEFKPERFHLAFSSSLAAGTQVVLRMYRDDATPQAQTPLQKLTVTIE